jgi:uncharacterized protein with HEPN domain
MKDDLANLEDIRIAANKVRTFISSVSYEKFIEDELVQSAVIRQLEIMGEAVKRLSPAFRSDHPLILWQQIAGLRDRLIHAYDDINNDRIWIIATQDVPDLLGKLPSST